MKRTSRRSVLSAAALLVCLACPASGQAPPDEPPPPMAAPGAEPAAAPAEPQPKSVVTVTDSLLSVELVDAPLGQVLGEISRQAGFRLEGQAESLGRRLTTRFTDLEIERALSRLFSLASEKNYFMHYDAAGRLMVIEFPGSGSSAVARNGIQPPAGRPVPLPVQPRGVSAPSPQAAGSGDPAVRTSPPPPSVPSLIRNRRRFIPVQPNTQGQAAADPEEGVTAEESFNGPTSEEPVNEVPYIPPQRKPLYIPPRPR